MHRLNKFYSQIKGKQKSILHMFILMHYNYIIEHIKCYICAYLINNERNVSSLDFIFNRDR